MKNDLFSQENRKAHFTHSYRIRKIQIYAKIRICGKMLLSYIFVWRKAQKIWYFRETETYENIIFSVLFTNFHEAKILIFMQGHDLFFSLIFDLHLIEYGNFAWILISHYIKETLYVNRSYNCWNKNEGYILRAHLDYCVKEL